MKTRGKFFPALVMIGVCFVLGAHAQQPTPADTPKPADKSAVKVTFDEETPGVAIIEVGGERVRVNTLKKTVEHVNGSDAENVAAARPAADKDKSAKQDDSESKYDFDKGDEPYDYRVVNIPTP